MALPALVIACASALAVGGALVFEHAFGYVPCMLCLWQRGPYYLGAPLALLAALLALGGRGQAARLALVAVGLLLLGGAGLGAFHAGVEWGFWPGPTACAGADAAPTAAGGLLERMRTTRIVPCDRAAWRLFGVSLAGYNVVVASLLVGVAAWAVLRPRLNA